MGQPTEGLPIWRFDSVTLRSDHKKNGKQHFSISYKPSHLEHACFVTKTGEEFLELSQLLSRLFPLVDGNPLPKLSKRKMLWGSVTQRRRDHLDLWLRRMVDIEAVHTSAPLYDFLCSSAFGPRAKPLVQTPPRTPIRVAYSLGQLSPALTLLPAYHGPIPSVPMDTPHVKMRRSAPHLRVAISELSQLPTPIHSHFPHALIDLGGLTESEAEEWHAPLPATGGGEGGEPLQTRLSKLVGLGLLVDSPSQSSLAPSVSSDRTIRPGIPAHSAPILPAATTSSPGRTRTSHTMRYAMSLHNLQSRAKYEVLDLPLPKRLSNRMTSPPLANLPDTPEDEFCVGTLDSFSPASAAFAGPHPIELPKLSRKASVHHKSTRTRTDSVQTIGNSSIKSASACLGGNSDKPCSAPSDSFYSSSGKSRPSMDRPRASSERSRSSSEKPRNRMRTRPRARSVDSDDSWGTPAHMAPSPNSAYVCCPDLSDCTPELDWADGNESTRSSLTPVTPLTPLSPVVPSWLSVADTSRAGWTPFASNLVPLPDNMNFNGKSSSLPSKERLWGKTSLGGATSSTFESMIEELALDFPLPLPPRLASPGDLITVKVRHNSGYTVKMRTACHLTLAALQEAIVEKFAFSGVRPSVPFQLFTTQDKSPSNMLATQEQWQKFANWKTSISLWC